MKPVVAEQEMKMIEDEDDEAVMGAATRERPWLETTLPFEEISFRFASPGDFRKKELDAFER